MICASSYLWSRPLIPLAAIRDCPRAVLQPHVAVRADVSIGHLDSDGERGWPANAALDATARGQPRLLVTTARHDQPIEYQRVLTFDRTALTRGWPPVARGPTRAGAVPSETIDGAAHAEGTTIEDVRSTPIVVLTSAWPSSSCTVRMS